jgi:Domain of unknown function (DUF1772)
MALLDNYTLYIYTVYYKCWNGAHREVIMFLTLQVLTVCLVAVAMALALAHALELPGKMRLDKAAYLATQPIYYPGFTVGGGIGEGGGMWAMLILLLLTPRASPEFRWTLAAFVALVAMHLAYWVFTHPVNKFWLRDHQLKGFSGGFFRFDPAGRSAPASEDDWRWLRRRWEYSHVARAALAVISFVCLVIAVAI